MNGIGCNQSGYPKLSAWVVAIEIAKVGLAAFSEGLGFVRV